MALVLVVWNPAKFLHPEQESDKCPLVCIFRCASQRLAYRRGHSLFILVTGSCRNLNAENKQKEVPRFFYNYTNGAFGANFPQKQNYMKKLSFFLLSLYLCSMSVPILAQFKKMYYLCTVNQRRGCLHINWRREADIIKGVYWRLFWSVEIRKIS